ncbi:MAG: right-handed parallel beta-helix repeat-containing protein [Thermodesulfobacteriota bacterium]
MFKRCLTLWLVILAALLVAIIPTQVPAQSRPISVLPELTAPTSADVLPIVSGGQTQKITLPNLLNAIWAHHHGGFTGAAISAALTEIGANVRILALAPGAWTISSDLTIPANVTLWPMPGAILNVAAGKTLTLNHKPLAGLDQIFSGTGTVVFGSGAVDELFPQWWGGGAGVADNAPYINQAIDAANACGATVKLVGDYPITSTVYLKRYVNIVGTRYSYAGASDPGARIIATGNITAVALTTANNAANVSMENLTIEQSSPRAGTGLLINTGLVNLRRVRTTGFQYGHKLESNVIWWDTIRESFIENCDYGVYINNSGSYNYTTLSYYNTRIAGCTYAVYAASTPVQNSVTIFRECNIETSTYGIYLGSCKTVKIDGCYFEQITNYAINADNSTQMTVSGCYFNSNGYGVYSVGPVANLTLIGNAFVGTATADIHIIGGAVASNVALINNQTTNTVTLTTAGYVKLGADSGVNNVIFFKGLFNINVSGVDLRGLYMVEQAVDFGGVSAQSHLDSAAINIGTSATQYAEMLVTPTTPPPAGLIFTVHPYAAASDYVVIRAHNYTAAAIDPASLTFRILVFKHLD